MIVDIPSSQPTFEVKLNLQNTLPINKQPYLPSSMVMMTFKYPSTGDEPDLEIKQLKGEIVEIKNHKENQEVRDF